MRRWTVTVVSALVLAAATVGCSGASDDDATPATTSTTVAFDVTTTLPPAAQAVVDECDAKMRSAAPDLAASSFPDAPDAEWTVVDLVTEVGLSFVEVEPSPADGLKPRYRLVVECRAEIEPVLYGIYALDGETWSLVSTTDALGDVELPETLG